MVKKGIALLLGIIGLAFQAEAQGGPKGSVRADELKGFAKAALYADEKNLSYELPDLYQAYRYDSLWLEE